MAYQDLIAAHITSMINEAPTALRNEIADAAAHGFGWEFWRLSQDPPVDDTNAARRAWARDKWALQIKQQLIAWVREFRRVGEDVGSEIDA